MIYLKLLVKPLLILMPPLVKIFIQRIWLRLSKPKIIKSIDNYKYTDEHLKFVHILEAINYLRVAGNMGKVLPQTYFEFGGHSTSETPGPFPNPAVKHRSADGTAS